MAERSKQELVQTVEVHFINASRSSIFTVSDTCSYLAQAIGCSRQEWHYISNRLFFCIAHI